MQFTKLHDIATFKNESSTFNNDYTHKEVKYKLTKPTKFNRQFFQKSVDRSGFKIVVFHKSYYFHHVFRKVQVLWRGRQSIPL